MNLLKKPLELLFLRVFLQDSLPFFRGLRESYENWKVVSIGLYLTLTTYLYQILFLSFTSEQEDHAFVYIIGVIKRKKKVTFFFKTHYEVRPVYQ